MLIQVPYKINVCVWCGVCSVGTQSMSLRLTLSLLPSQLSITATQNVNESLEIVDFSIIQAL